MVYTVVYEGDPAGAKILSGEPAPGRALTVMAGDCYAELRSLQAAISDPITVHVNMLAGKIAKPSLRNIIHLYGAEALREALDPSAQPAPLAREGSR